MRTMSDRTVMFALCAVCAIAISTMLLFGGNIKISFSKQGDFDAHSSSKSPIKHYVSKKYGSHDGYYYDDVAPRQLHLKPFDPNTADATTLEGLGLARWQVKSILNFRAKGGEFRTPEDFARVYKLTAKQYRQLRPYIQISNDYLPASSLIQKTAGEKEQNEDTYQPYAKISKGEFITLNDADTTLLRRVPGIGPYFAKEILYYEKRLGGYVNIDQLSEIEHFPEEAKQYFQIDLSKVKKLNINKLSFSKLRAHPYINYYQAREIIEYRHKYGNIKSLDELKLSPYFAEDDMKRIKPYIEY